MDRAAFLALGRAVLAGSLRRQTSKVCVGDPEQKTKCFPCLPPLAWAFCARPYVSPFSIPRPLTSACHAHLVKPVAHQPASCQTAPQGPASDYIDKEKSLRVRQVGVCGNCCEPSGHCNKRNNNKLEECKKADCEGKCKVRDPKPI